MLANPALQSSLINSLTGISSSSSQRLLFKNLATDLACSHSDWQKVCNIVVTTNCFNSHISGWLIFLLCQPEEWWGVDLQFTWPFKDMQSGHAFPVMDGKFHSHPSSDQRRWVRFWGPERFLVKHMKEIITLVVLSEWLCVYYPLILTLFLLPAALAICQFWWESLESSKVEAYLHSVSLRSPDSSSCHCDFY